MNASYLSPSCCVILVPVAHRIEPDCDTALRELERRGYPVWRVYGYASIDLGRSQMATDALAAGFLETFWIDSDVAFDPNEIAKIRAANRPITCGIYPKKLRRELAVSPLVGTECLYFGTIGGAYEVRYAATGFLHVRKEVYDAVQKRCSLPTCALGNGTHVIPFFLPLIVFCDNDFRYFSEDYSFCERVRQCNFKIIADTSVRLWHLGNYPYGWEDAGRTCERHSSYTHVYNLDNGNPGKVPLSIGGLSSNENMNAKLDSLRREFAWPLDRPSVKETAGEDWLCSTTQEVLARYLDNRTTVVVELGSWLGRSSQFLARHAQNATIISIDHWLGSPEHIQSGKFGDLLPVLYETFLTNCWDYRSRIIPLRLNTVDGLQTVASHDIQPDLIYVDADHSYEAVVGDLEAIIRLFPAAIIVGDDWNWEGVRVAAATVASKHGLTLEYLGTGWVIMPSFSGHEQGA